MISRCEFDHLITDLLHSIVREFVQYPADLTIMTCGPETIVDIVWSANKADISRMIGEGGKTFHFLKELMHMVGNRYGYEVTLNRISEPTKGKVERYTPSKFGSLWPKARLLALLERTVREATVHSLVEIAHSDLDDNTSAVIVRIGRNESSRMETNLREALQHTFKVVFNAQGRLIRLTVDRSLTPEAMQPKTAAGRFAGER